MTEQQDEPKLSIVDEARQIRDEIIKQKEELKTEREALEKVKSENLLSGTAGGHISPQPPKKLTDAEVVNRFKEKLKNGVVKDEKEIYE
jgi:hypothetical protein